MSAAKRKIRMGMVGGGRGAFIGGVHRMAAALDGQIELVCGAFSSDPQRSRDSGADFFLPPNRCYGTFEEMMKSEAALPLGERMDFVAIVTPNHVHFPEIAVATLRRKEEVGSRVARALRVAAKCAADEFDLAVEGCCHAVDASNEGSTAAADHAHADFAFGCAH